MPLESPNLYAIAERLDSHTTLLEDIQTHVKATNGRVTKLERAWSYAKGAAAAFVLIAGYLGSTGHLHFH